MSDAWAICDGSFGPSRRAMPEGLRRTWERTYPFAWFGILADMQPSTDELIYAWHPDGFAFHSMRSESVSRLYLQVPPDTDPVTWSDDQIWEALARRLGHGQNVIGRGQRRAGQELRGPADVHIRHVRRGRPGRPR